MKRPTILTPERGLHGAEPGPPEKASLALADVERAHIERILSACGGNVSQAALLLQVDRRTLQRKLSRWQAHARRRSGDR